LRKHPEVKYIGFLNLLNAETIILYLCSSLISLNSKGHSKNQIFHSQSAGSQQVFKNKIQVTSEITRNKNKIIIKTHISHPKPTSKQDLGYYLALTLLIK